MHQDVLDLILANVRLGNLVEGDLLAQLGSAERGRRLILEFCEEFGTETVEAYAEEVIAYSDRRMGAVIEKFPDGTYHGSGWVDSDGYDAKDVPVEVAVTVEGDQVVVDFAGTGVQAEGGLNSSVATTLTAGRVPFLFYADADIPHNQGCLDHIEVRAPKGSIADPEYPASTSCATVVPAGMFHDAINKALAEAIPDLVMGGTARCSNVPAVLRHRHRDRRGVGDDDLQRLRRLRRLQGGRRLVAAGVDRGDGRPEIAADRADGAAPPGAGRGDGDRARLDGLRHHDRRLRRALHDPPAARLDGLHHLRRRHRQPAARDPRRHPGDRRRPVRRGCRERQPALRLGLGPGADRRGQHLDRRRLRRRRLRRRRSSAIPSASAPRSATA